MSTPIPSIEAIVGNHGGAESHVGCQSSKLVTSETPNEPNRMSIDKMMALLDLRPMASILATQNEPNRVTALSILRRPEDVTTEITESTEEMLEDREQADWDALLPGDKYCGRGGEQSQERSREIAERTQSGKRC